MSLYKTDSQLARVNSAAGRTTVKVDDELIQVVQAAKTYHEITGGSFDITVEPLMNLWGFRHEPPSLRKRPSDAEIQSRLDAVGFSHVSIDEKNQAIGLDHSDSKIDLGGIAVGFSVDLAVRALQSEGIKAAFINHSGDAYALGKPENDSGWRVGIPNPAKPEEIVVSLTLSNKAISTSGNYEKFIDIESHRYGHIFDPSLGTPSDAALSTTVIAPSALAADALSTGIFCMDIPRAEKIIAETTGAQAFIVSSDGKTTFLEGKGT